ncbi:protein FAR1-RELATED SEQUENCE 5-like [Macadamia integrifolia]|uniref:protein FAR1-RELATED SEQUENCE 5-like n=1 Tax=Macadamia integrifolia TaxID=60698 RepID=UPI001C4E900D|nr:protein FAR1-RELATED SEQUENCE 5-like [Macadamia integrifolia]
MVKYNLKDNSWCIDKFAQKEHWVPCYLKRHFFARMSSAQQSEGMNSYVQGYFKGTMTLFKFVKQYEKAIARRREKEAEAEFRTCTKLPQLSSHHPMEEHAGKMYTMRVFDIFKKHFTSSISLSAKEEAIEGEVCKFLVGTFKIPIEERCVVVYDSSKEEVQCGCHLFEFMGALCKHALKVLHIEDYDAIPSKYILFRWTKEASTGMSFDSLRNTPECSTTRSLWRLWQANSAMMSLACSSQEACVAAMRMLQGFCDSFSTKLPNSNEGGFGESTHPTQSTVESRYKTHKHMKVPLPAISRGRPKSKGLEKHPMEECKGKRKNRCSKCGCVRHNKTKCELTNRNCQTESIRGEDTLDGALSDM